MRSLIAVVVCVLALAGCGGGGDSPPPVVTPPPPVIPPPPPPPVIGTNGGTITETSGAAVVFPAGAVATDTTFRIAVDSSGAPPMATDFGGTGNVYVVTPHGGEFAEAVEVRIPAPSVTLQPNQEFKIAKAEPGGQWIVLGDAQVVDGKLSVQVHDFSYFRAVVVTYRLPIAQAEPISFTTSIVCAGRPDCNDVLGPITATFTAVGNNGQVPQICGTDPTHLYIGNGVSYNWLMGGLEIPGSGGTVTAAAIRGATNDYTFGVWYGCSWNHWSTGAVQNVSFRSMPEYPGTAVLSMPAQLDVVEGLPANLDAIVGGGAVETPSYNFDDYYRTPTADDHATVDWERSDNGGASWRVVARSFQNEGNPRPYGVGNPWQPWSVRHGFIASGSDQGALIRARACYTPPAPAAASPCSVGIATRINVLQQSALPAIVGQPRSVLIRTAETANLSVTVTGLPAPTLQWQTRPANSTNEWTNVAVGTGATTTSYTTAPRAPSDNGEQYRVVATNAVGSAASTPVTVSVSDLDVAPSITTQPASLNVTSGNDAVFAVVAYGTEALSYQWRFNGTNIAGANSPVLRLTGVSNTNAGSYSVSVTNNAGNMVSNLAVLSVTAGTPVAVAPSIVTQPVSVTVNVGNTATFAVGVDGTGPLSFQWRRDGSNIAGATSAALTFNSVALPNAGTYSVVVTNSAGAVVSNNVTLDVAPAAGALPPTITSEPSTVIVPAGGSAMLAVGATGSGPLSYQWSLNGHPIPGATLPVLSLSNVGNANVGDYTVAVVNSVASTNSQVAQLILLGAPVITQDPAAALAGQGSTATFSVTAKGSGLRYQWLQNGSPISGATEASYTTPMLVTANSGAVYSVTVYNDAGLVLSQGAVLTVQIIDAPSVAQHPANATVVAGQSTSLCAAFIGTFPMTLHMQRWNGTSWPDLLYTTMVDNSVVCYSTPILELADDGAEFRFLAENAAGLNVTYTATVTVTAPVGPVITTTTLVSRATSGGTANNRSGEPSLSADGNIVAFISEGTNLVPGMSGYPLATTNAYVRNLSTGITTLINQTPAGTQSQSPYGVIGLKLAAGGRYAIFSSLAGDLVANDDNGSQDVFVRDLQAGTTTRVSLRADGSQITNAGNGQGDMHLDISADGRFVSFMSTQDLIGNEPSGNLSLYLRSTQTGFLRRVASSTASTTVGYSALSGNGEHMAYLYATFAPNPVRNIIVHYDAEANAYDEVFNIDSTNDASFVGQGVGISGNGRYITFPLRSPARNFGSTFTQVLAIDRDNPNVITMASGNFDGGGDGHSSWPQVSDDGHVLFMTNAGNLTGNFANGVVTALVVRDLHSFALRVASRRPDGTNIAISSAYAYHAISSDGTAVAFAADEFNMSGGGLRENQVYVTPRP